MALLTLGDHVVRQEGVGEYLERERHFVRAANFLEPTDPGTGRRPSRHSDCGSKWQGLGQVFMREEVSSPFEAADQAVEELKRLGADLLLVDVHAETTSEKQAMDRHLVGRVTAAVRAHIHCLTADLTVLPGGTAFATDASMTGGRDSTIALSREGSLSGVAFLGQVLIVERVFREHPKVI